jgi:hypothetical protein
MHIRQWWQAMMLFALSIPASAQTGLQWPADLPPTPADRAQIVFIKPSGTMPGHPVGILQVDGDKRELLAVLARGNYAVATVPAGQHRFMAHVGVTHFLDANVQAGERYVVLVRFIYGNGYQLRPIRVGGPSDYSTSNPKIAGWLTEVKPADPRHPKVRWYGLNDAKLTKHQARGQTTWDRKTDAERAQLTLNPEDAL